MTTQEKSLIAPLVYYDLLDRPLTILEIYKYQSRAESTPSVFPLAKTRKLLKNSPFLNNQLAEKDGLYFLKGRKEIIDTRSYRLKISQNKWKKIKKITRQLGLIPFIRLAAVTGSLTAYNATPESDLDVLLITKTNRLWLTRLLSIGIIGLLGQRRHDQVTKDRLCLNCYLTEENLEIKPEKKPHNWHSAHEYYRLTPVLELTSGTYQKFINQNGWLAIFFQNHPWPNKQLNYKTSISCPANWFRHFFEWVLCKRIGNWLEKKSGNWQKQRIRRKSLGQAEPNDQIYASDCCLMLHPRSKSYQLNNNFNLKMQQLS